MNGKIEILAPAGGCEQLLAAVRCGADAVYLGMKSFSARQGAENFSREELASAVSYCHGRGTAVHVAVNTVMTDAELPELWKTADDIAATGADAVILQDLAAVRLFREKYPSIKRHMSTQAAVHNVEGALAAIDMGFDRVVLARELSLEEIREIARTGIECEVFVHGALCVCVSGTCYLSSALGGRSGNRGRCAQPCRLNFSNGERDYALSLKDMSHIRHIGDLKAAGVVSLKIEGRLKRPEYVAAAVTACRNATEGKSWDEAALRAVFSRAGFTDGYLTGKRDASMFGRRDESAVGETNAVLGSIRELYRRERSSVPVDMELTVLEDSPVSLRARCEEIAAEAMGEPPQRALNRPADRESVLRSLEKTGGTPFYLRELKTDIGSGLAIPASSLNALKREALDKILAAREEIHPIAAEPFEPVRHEARKASSQGEALWARFAEAEQICCLEELERIVVPAEEVIFRPELTLVLGEKLAAELPFLAFPSDEKRVLSLAEKLRELGVKRVYADNIYGVRLGRRLGFQVSGGFGLNITNTEALEEYASLGLADAVVSVELPARAISNLGGSLCRGIAAYGHIPLMRFRCCPARKSSGCGDCGGRPQLTDRYGTKFDLVCSEKRFMSLLNPVPLDIADRRICGADFRLLYFTTESRRECEQTVLRFVSGVKTEEKRTTGMYFSKLL